jgi:predicted dehydrogenase
MTRTAPSPERQDGLTRRDFLCSTATAGAALALAGAAAGAQVSAAPSAKVRGANERLGVGFIGVGGRGSNHLDYVHWLKTQGNEAVEIVAVCDVYRPRVERAAEGYNAKAYMDYRELLADPRVDIVCIATPDHHHGIQSIAAMKAGKDVYCEKPVTHWRQFDVIKELAQTARGSGRVFQLGTQGMSDGAWRQMKQLVKDGAIGQPLFGETGFFRVGDWGERGMPVDNPSAKPGPDLNWEAFLGDSPKREFDVSRFFRWRLYDDYAGGPVTDLYPHCLTQVIDILGVSFPKAVVALGGVHRYEYELREVPDTCNLLIDYPEKISISLVGTQGNNYQGTGQRGSGQRIPIIRGWEGTLTIEGKEIVFIPAEGSTRKPQRWAIEQEEDMIGHWRNFLDCCRTRQQQTWSPADLAYYTQTALIMAAWSQRQGKVAKFDREQQKIVI